MYICRHCDRTSSFPPAMLIKRHQLAYVHTHSLITVLFAVSVGLWRVETVAPRDRISACVDDVPITSSAGALRSIVMSTSACVCVSVLPRGYLRNHKCDLNYFWFSMAVVRYSSGKVTKSQEEGAVLGVVFPIKNA